MSLENGDTVSAWNSEDLSEQQLREILFLVLDYLGLEVKYYCNENTNDQPFFEVKVEEP
jgi:hypothetical protein